MSSIDSNSNTPRTRFSMSFIKGPWGFFRTFVTPIPKEWVDPPDLEAYLNAEGFIVRKYWAQEQIDKYPLVLEDLDTLEKHLVPLFLSYNQRAKYYQNAYYFYQRIFIIGAFLTTILAVVTTYFSNRSIDGSVGPLFGTIYKGDDMLELFSVLTTVVSAITGYFTILSQKGEPRKGWSNYRRLAEDLRMTYFKYLSHQAPYNQLSRVDVLRNNLYETRKRGRAINA